MPRHNGAIRREDHRRNRPYIEGGGGNKKPKPFRSDMTPNEKQLWFEQALKYDFIDSKYGTFDQLNTVLNWLRGSGLGDAEIRRLLGFKTDNPVIKKGKIYGRGIRESASPAARADLDAVLGQGTTSSVEKYLRSKWAKARKLLTLEDVRTGKWSDLGHFIEGSLRDPDLAAGENAVINRSRGSEGEPERFPSNVVEDIAPVNPDEQVWNAAAEQNGGIEKRSGLKGSFPQDVAELADFGHIEPDAIPILAQKLENVDPIQRKAVIEHARTTGEIKLDINPDQYKTADLTATNGSGKVSDTAKNGTIGNGNGSNGKQAGYTVSEWRDWLAKQVPIRELANINNAIRLAASTPAGRAARVVAPSAAGAAVAAFSTADALAREEKYKKEPTLLNRIQRDLGAVEATSDTAGAIPGPQSLVAEPAGLVSGLLNVSIDALRDGTVEKMRQVRASIRFMP